jgi:DUF1680 family protein
MRRLPETFGVLGGTVILLGAIAGFACGGDAMTALEPADVKVGGEIGRRIDVTVNNNLLVLDADKDFLAPFQKKEKKDGYVGLGKLINAAVRLAAYTRDEKVLALKKHLVEKAIEAQEPDGYLGIMQPESRMWGMWDIHEMQYAAWGLLSDHRLFGEKRSLEAARKIADYILARWPAMPKEWDARTGVATHVSVTGLERTMIALAQATGDKKYADFCLKERALAEWDLPIIIGRRDLIQGHIYAYMCRSLAQLELYRTVPDERLLNQARRAMDFLTRSDGLAITGGAGQWEIWTDDQDGRGQLGETCATAYQIRVYDSLLRLRGDARMGDLLERTIWNALFAAQSPDGRRIRYYAPTEGNREYHPTDTYCCPCNFRRIVAELPAMVYYRTENGVAVSLYGSSEAKVALGGGVTAALRQETDYPNSGRVVVRVDPSKPATFLLSLRIPAWCKTAKVSVNGQAAEQPAGGTFFAIHREWKAGDQVTLEMPMDWRFVLGRKRQAGRVAVMRGPLVFCLNPAQNPALEKMDGADLGRIQLNPKKIEGPIPDASVRPDGIACRLRGWKPGYGTKPPGDLDLKFTEFPDPDGKATYFRLQDYSVGVEDELFAR